MGLFSDLGVCYATHINEMQLDTFTNQPTALFIKIPLTVLATVSLYLIASCV